MAGVGTADSALDKVRDVFGVTCISLLSLHSDLAWRLRSRKDGPETFPATDCEDVQAGTVRPPLSPTV